MKEDIERRRMQAAAKMKTLSASVEDGEEMFSPLSPTHKVTLPLRSVTDQIGRASCRERV